MRELFRLIRSDYRRYDATGQAGWITVLLTQGFWASFVYRISRSVFLLVRPTPLRKPVRVLLAFAQKFMEILTGISIPPECEIGEGLYIGHFGNIFLPSQGRLGRNCNISQGVTIGLAGHGDNRGAPTIGDRVYIAPYGIVVGRITVGNDAVICAGALVTRSVPPRAVMLGNPARIISYEGSFQNIKYDGMNTDPDRLAALAAREPLSRTPAVASSATVDVPTPAANEKRHPLKTFFPRSAEIAGAVDEDRPPTRAAGATTRP